MQTNVMSVWEDANATAGTFLCQLLLLWCHYGGGASVCYVLLALYEIAVDVIDEMLGLDTNNVLDFLLSYCYNLRILR